MLRAALISLQAPSVSDRGLFFENHTSRAG